MQEQLTRAEYKARQELCDERFRRDKERLTCMEDTLKTLGEVSVKLSILVEQHETKLDRQDTKIGSLELKPAKRWESVVGDVIKYAVALALGFIAAKAGLGGL